MPVQLCKKAACLFSTVHGQPAMLLMLVLLLLLPHLNCSTNTELASVELANSTHWEALALQQQTAPQAAAQHSALHADSAVCSTASDCNCPQ